MAQPSASDLVFTVRRRQPELVTPAKPTPREFKLLSDIDDQDGLRCRIPMVHFYPYEQSMQGKDPVQLIRNALAQTLVFYYPLAGRLREGPGRKLIVDCNEEGVVLSEADADVTIHQFGDPIQPPFPCFEELLYNVPGSEGIVNCPLLVVQVTRLKCGGFVLGYFVNHTVCDGPGMAQFLGALAEIARGANEPSVTPVWCRELLNARDLLIAPMFTFRFCLLTLCFPHRVLILVCLDSVSVRCTSIHCGSASIRLPIRFFARHDSLVTVT